MTVAKSCTLKIRGGSNTYIKWDGSVGTAGKGPLIQWERSGTLGVTQDQTLFVWMTDSEYTEPPDTVDNKYICKKE